MLNNNTGCKTCNFAPYIQQIGGRPDNVCKRKPETIDDRIALAFEMEDPDIILDLREHNHGEKIQFDDYFKVAQSYIENNVEMAPDDRRHNTICHLASAISLSDLHREVSQLCPKGHLFHQNNGYTYNSPWLIQGTS